MALCRALPAWGELVRNPFYLRRGRVFPPWHISATVPGRPSEQLIKSPRFPDFTHPSRRLARQVGFQVHQDPAMTGSQQLFPQILPYKKATGKAECFPFSAKGVSYGPRHGVDR